MARLWIVMLGLTVACCAQQPPREECAAGQYADICPARHKVDREALVWSILQGAAATAAMVETRRALDSNPAAVELNPMFGRRPSLHKQLLVGVPLTAGGIYLGRHAFAHGHRWWGRILGAEFTAGYTAAAVNDSGYIR